MQRLADLHDLKEPSHTIGGEIQSLTASDLMLEVPIWDKPQQATQSVSPRLRR